MSWRGKWSVLNTVLSALSRRWMSHKIRILTFFRIDKLKKLKGGTKGAIYQNASLFYSHLQSSQSFHIHPKSHQRTNKIPKYAPASAALYCTPHNNCFCAMLLSLASKASSKLIRHVLLQPRIIPLSMAFTTAALTSNNKNSYYYTSYCADKTTTAITTTPTPTRKTPAAPPRFGKSMPHHLLSRPFTTTLTTKKDIPIPTTTNRKNKEDSIQQQQSILVSKSKAGEKRDESSCPLCKKYSQGPCGKLFQKWIECIDANEHEHENEGDASKCDSLVVPLDKCLKEHQEYYDKISIHDNADDNDQVAIDKWKDFILAIEQEDGIRFESFPPSHDAANNAHDHEPEMQLRPKSNMGAAMFHPEMGDQVLLLAYIKDQDGNLLGAGSVEDLFPFQDHYVLRFGVTAKCKDITAHALYGYKDGADGSDHGSDESLTIYTKTQRVPPS